MIADDDIVSMKIFFLICSLFNIYDGIATVSIRVLRFRDDDDGDDDDASYRRRWRVCLMDMRRRR